MCFQDVSTATYKYTKENERKKIKISWRLILPYKKNTYLPPHFAGSNRNASKARFWHKDSAMSMYLKHERVPCISLSKFNRAVQK
jgi:hypothetical protein